MERRLKAFLCVVTVHDNDDKFFCIFWWETQPLSEDRVPPDPDIDLMEQFHGWKHRGTERFQVQWEAAKITFLFFFNFLGQLVAPQIVLMIKHQSRGVPTWFCTVFLAQFSAFAFWEDYGNQSTPKAVIAYFVIQKASVFFLMSPLQVYMFTAWRGHIPTRYFFQINIFWTHIVLWY